MRVQSGHHELEPNPCVDVLSGLLHGEATVAGGSFSGWLPGLGSVEAEARVSLLRIAEGHATRSCLLGLLRTHELVPVEPGRLSDGRRDWPNGWTGSVSHKGTVVVAALARCDRVEVVGIDVETLGESLAQVPVTAPGEVLPAVADPLTTVFSAKESAFKAGYQATRRRLRFDQVSIRWRPSDSHLVGTALYAEFPLVIRCSLEVPGWVVSSAVSGKPETNV